MLIGYSYYTQPSEEQLEAQRKEQLMKDSLAIVEAQKEKEITSIVEEEINNLDTSVTDSVFQAAFDEKMAARFGDLVPAAKGKAEEIIIENPYYLARLSSRGGMLTYLELKDYKTYDSLPLVLFEEKHSSQDLYFDYPGFGRIHFKDLYFDANTDHISLDEGDAAQRLVLEAKGRHSGQSLKLIYELSGEDHNLKMSIVSNGFDAFDNFNSTPLTMDWKMTPLKKEKHLPWERQITSIFYRYADKSRDWLSETRDDDELLEETTEWVAFKQNYFSVILFSDKGFKGNESRLEVKNYEEEEEELVRDLYASLRLPQASNGNMEFNYFFGPNRLEYLKPYGSEVPKIINYGWSIIGWINRNVIYYIFNAFYDIGWGIGFAIILLTIVIKLVLAPLMLKNYKSSAKMRVLKPEVDKINKKFEGKDNTQKQQAIMALYRETGVNPLSGCLPMLVQMPVLYAMFRFFPSNITMRGESFLWADDLSSYDSILDLGFSIPLYGDHISLFTLLMAGTTMAYTYMSSSNMPETNQPGMPNMKVMMYIFPVMMIFFFNNYSSGLTFYYFLSTLISIIQMWVIKSYFIDEEKILAKLEANKAKPKKKSKFQAKLEEMQRQQQQMKKG